VGGNLRTGTRTTLYHPVVTSRAPQEVPVSQALLTPFAREGVVTWLGGNSDFSGVSSEVPRRRPPHRFFAQGGPVAGAQLARATLAIMMQR
jgi:hypothetical protein